MAERQTAPGSPRILLTNDDGIDAPGLALLETIARGLCEDVWVVAPEQEQSGAGHSLTTRRPLRLRERADQRHTVDGTPTDCVLVAVKRLLRQRVPTLVLSGINAGANLAEDLTYSGTVAAAMEATLLGIPAIALSQHYRERAAIPWATAETWGPRVIRRLMRFKWPAGTLININFPAVPPDAVRGIAVTRQGRRPVADNMVEGVDPRGRPYYWIGPTPETSGAEAGTDLSAIAEARVSVSPIFLDMTHHSALAALREALA